MGIEAKRQQNAGLQLHGLSPKVGQQLRVDPHRFDPLGVRAFAAATRRRDGLNHVGERQIHRPHDAARFDDDFEHVREQRPRGRAISAIPTGVADARHRKREILAVATSIALVSEELCLHAVGTGWNILNAVPGVARDVEIDANMLAGLQPILWSVNCKYLGAVLLVAALRTGWWVMHAAASAQIHPGSSQGT